MFKVGQSVYVVDQRPEARGVVSEVSDWKQVVGKPSSGPCYFVQVPEWDNNTNSGRWLSEESLRDAAR